MTETAAIVPATDGDASLREALRCRISSIRSRVATFRVDARGVARGQVRARVEHVVSGEAPHFSSVQQLLGFIALVLAQALHKEQ